MTDRRFDRYRRDGFETCRRELMDRLRRVCGHMQRSELEDLAARMTRLRFKYDRVTALPAR